MTWGQHGYLVIPSTLFPSACDALLMACEGMALNGPAMQPHRTDPAILEAMRLPEIVGPIEAAVNGPASGLQSVFYRSPPGTEGFAPHQDNAFVQAPDDAFASAWIPLVDVTPHNGCLRVWPGSHKFGRLPSLSLAPTEHSGQQDPNANKTHTLLPAGYPHEDIEARRGTMILMHGNLVHASHANRSDKDRPALLLTYIRKGASFRPGARAMRAEVELA